MFNPLPHEQYPSVQPLFAGLPSALIVQAVLEGTSPGGIWVDDVDKPTTGFMHSVEGDFLVGNPHNAGFNSGFKVHIPVLDDDHLVIECDSEGWRSTLDDLFDKRVVLEPRLYYEFERPLLDWRGLLPADVVMAAVDVNFLQRSNLKNMPAVTDWIQENWSSQAEALKYDFGRCLVHDAVIASWCLVDCVSGTRCEIGIHTDPAFRKRGYAAVTVSAAVEAAIGKGFKTIGWHCWEHNIASRKVAEKVGFKLVHPYPAYVCVNDHAHYAIEVGIMAARASNHHEALQWYESAGEAPWAYFLAARSYATVGEIEPALKMLWKALDHGWAAAEYLLADEFAVLHNQPDWHRLLADPRLQT